MTIPILRGNHGRFFSLESLPLQPTAWSSTEKCPRAFLLFTLEIPSPAWATVLSPHLAQPNGRPSEQPARGHHARQTLLLCHLQQVGLLQTGLWCPLRGDRSEENPKLHKKLTRPQDPKSKMINTLGLVLLFLLIPKTELIYPSTLYQEPRHAPKNLIRIFQVSINWRWSSKPVVLNCGYI